MCTQSSNFQLPFSLYVTSRKPQARVSSLTSSHKKSGEGVYRKKSTSTPKNKYPLDQTLSWHMAPGQGTCKVYITEFDSTTSTWPGLFILSPRICRSSGAYRDLRNRSKRIVVFFHFAEGGSPLSREIDSGYIRAPIKLQKKSRSLGKQSPTFNSRRDLRIT